MKKSQLKKRVKKLEKDITFLMEKVIPKLTLKEIFVLIKEEKLPINVSLYEYEGIYDKEIYEAVKNAISQK
jgi:hypothetical protein